MDLDYAVDFFKGLATKVAEVQKEAAYAAALDGLALIKTRVIKTGVNAEGSKFRDYSDTVLPGFFAKSRTGKKPNKGPASYKDIRESAGLQTDHRDFKFTGRMWANIHPLITAIRGNSLVIEYKAREEQDKVDWNTDRDGNFLKPNAEEIVEITKSYNQYFIENMLR